MNWHDPALRIGFLLGMLAGLVFALICIALIGSYLRRVQRGLKALNESNEEMKRTCECVVAEAARLQALAERLSRELGIDPPPAHVWTIQ